MILQNILNICKCLKNRLIYWSYLNQKLQKNIMRTPISASIRLQICLRYSASGDIMAAFRECTISAIASFHRSLDVRQE